MSGLRTVPRPDGLVRATRRAWRVIAFLSAILVGSAPGVAAAQDDPPPLPRPAVVDSARADTLLVPPAPARTPAVRPADQTSQLKQPVRFSAADSLTIDFRAGSGASGNAGRAALFGDANVTYGDAVLDAWRVDILFDLDELRAAGLASDTGLVGIPRFAQGSNTFSGTGLAYNLQTERGRVVEARTSLDEGFITGQVVKVTEDTTLYILGGAYTTCDCPPGETPSYSLRSRRMKVVDQKWVYTGPIQLYLFNIPTPLWLPFGYLPYTEGRRSGPLPPAYGEDERGFYLRDWGWYWAINEYLDAQLQAGLWSRGSWQIAPLLRYARRYRYSGQFALDYGLNRRGEADDPDHVVQNTSSIRWNHNQDINPTTRLTANVNLASSGYLRNVSSQYEDQVRQTIESSVRLSKRWPNTGRNLGLNLSQRQVLATGEATLALPNLSFTQSTRKPFERDNRPAGSREQWYERITYSYTGQLNNRYVFDPLPEDSLVNRGATDIAWYDALVSPGAYRLATGEDVPFDIQASHRVPISASFAINRIPILDRTLRLNLSTNVNYSEDWFVQTERRAFDPERNRVVTETVPGFFALRRFTTGGSANTTFYGLFPWRVGPFNGFRHTVRPSLSFTYAPDFGADFWGYTRTYRDAEDAEVPYGIVSSISPHAGAQQTLSLSIGNDFETKLARTDTTGETLYERLKLLDLSVSTGYNFARDSFALSPLNLSARTNLFDQVNIVLTSSLDPYGFTEVRRTNPDAPPSFRRSPSYVFDPLRLRFARLTSLSLTAQTSFRSQRSAPGRPSSTPRVRPGFFDPRGDAPLDPFDPFSSPFYTTPVGYADFAIPWALSFDFSFGFQRPFREVQRRATINTSFDFNLTPRWKVQGRSGYDLAQGEFVTTNVTILRDFECWEMSFNWVPFGRYKSYSFDLHVKSGKLRDLLRIRQPSQERGGIFN